jgi:dTDP-4-amino-4,6-dideoxygalactose transaminase
MVNFGFSGPEDVVKISTNARMNEFEAAMGICNLHHFEVEQEKRKVVAERYHKHLDGIEGIHFIAPQEGITQNYSYFPVFFDGYKYDRNEVQAKLAEYNILARKYFYPIISEMECYTDMFASQDFPVSKHASETVLALPMYADLEMEEVDLICKIILD